MKQNKCPVTILKSRLLALWFLPLVIGLTGCISRPTIQSRIQQRNAAYAALTPAVKQLVAEGRIQAGMDTNAVYMAWGRPEEILQSGDQRGEYTTWVYRGAYLEETRYWVGRRVPHLSFDYEPRTYVRAEIIFANGKVQSWRTLPQPAY